VSGSSWERATPVALMSLSATGVARSHDRRFFLLGGLAAGLLPLSALAAEELKIGAARGTIDFAIGDSRIFRTTGSFKDWQGALDVDDVDVSRSKVAVKIRTASIDMLDAQQTAMLKDTEFFDVAKFPEMTYVSQSVVRTGESTLKVEGDVTLRGITRPMALDVSVTDRKADAPAGARYARFRATGTLKRSEFGMVKFVDVVGDAVDISIRTDAWR
jgi:polyisoprenoid-binding protein YceI